MDPHPSSTPAPFTAKLPKSCLHLLSPFPLLLDPIVTNDICSNCQPTGLFHPHVTQPLSRTEAAGWPLHLKRVLWAPGRHPLSVFLFHCWLLLSVFLLAPHKWEDSEFIPGTSSLSHLQVVFLVNSFNQELKIPSIARGLQLYIHIGSHF